MLKLLTIFSNCTGRFVSDLVGNPEDQFYHAAAQKDTAYNIIDRTNHMSRLVGKPTMWFLNRSDINRPVQLQKQARSLEFWN